MLCVPFFVFGDNEVSRIVFGTPGGGRREVDDEVCCVPRIVSGIGTMLCAVGICKKFFSRSGNGVGYSRGLATHSITLHAFPRYHLTETSCTA